MAKKLTTKGSIICRATTVIEIPFAVPQDTFTIFYDIDGTVARYTGDYEKYEFGEPLHEVIDILNYYKADGATLVPYTSRKDDEKEALIKWLDENCVPYDDIIMNKPHFDVLIDDKVVQFTGDPVILEDTLNKFRTDAYPYWKTSNLGTTPVFTPLQNYDEGIGRSEQRNKRVKVKEKDTGDEQFDNGAPINTYRISRIKSFDVPNVKNYIA